VTRLSEEKITRLFLNSFEKKFSAWIPYFPVKTVSCNIKAITVFEIWLLLLRNFKDLDFIGRMLRDRIKFFGVTVAFSSR
jgi:hypothetical protein